MAQPPYPELYRECKRKGQLWLSKTVLIRLKDMEKDITLERLFFIYRQGNIDMNYQCIIYVFLTHSNHVP